MPGSGVLACYAKELLGWATVGVTVVLLVAGVVVLRQARRSAG